MSLRRMIWIVASAVMIAVLTIVALLLIKAQQPEARSTITTFSFSHRGTSTYDIYSYELLKDEETGKMTVRCEFSCGNEVYVLPAEDEFIQDLSEIVDNHAIEKWDGFNKSNSFMLDGSGFSLYIGFTDGTDINAYGSNRFPKGYIETSDSIDLLFLTYLKKYGIEPEGGLY